MDDFLFITTFRGFSKWAKHISEKLGWVMLDYHSNVEKSNCYKKMLVEFKKRYEILRIELSSELKLRDIEILYKNVILIANFISYHDEYMKARGDMVIPEENHYIMETPYECTFACILEEFEHLMCHFGCVIIEVFRTGNQECLHMYKHKLHKFHKKVEYNLKEFSSSIDKYRDLEVVRVNIHKFHKFVHECVFPITKNLIASNIRSRALSTNKSRRTKSFSNEKEFDHVYEDRPRSFNNSVSNSKRFRNSEIMDDQFNNYYPEPTKEDLRRLYASKSNLDNQERMINSRSLLPDLIL